MTTRRIAISLFLLSVLFFTAYNAVLPITDPVESNYALTAKEMVQSGDWISPRIYGHYWFDKPIMIYWLIAGSFTLFGITEWAARLPAALFSAASISFIYWFGERLFRNSSTALWSAVVLGTALEYWVLAHMIITDAVLFFFQSAAMGLLYLYWREGKSSVVFARLAYVAAGFAVLTKGPVGIVLPGLLLIGYAVLSRQWRLLRQLYLWPGLLIFLGITAPWYGMMYHLHGVTFVKTFLGLHNYVRATISEHPKDNVFYYYLVLFPASLLPWTGVVLQSLCKKGRNLFTTPPLNFLWYWMLGIVLFYSLMATKYPTYVFPATFPAALLAGQILAETGYRRRRQWLWLSVPLLLLVVLIAFAQKLLPLAISPFFSYLVLAGLALITIGLQWKGACRLLPYWAAVAAVTISLLLLQTALIPITHQRSAKDIVQYIVTEHEPEIGLYGEYATSADFYTNQTIPLIVDEYPTGERTVWAGKHTMPLITGNDFTAKTAEKVSYIVVSHKQQQHFEQQSWAQGYQQVSRNKDILLYLKDNSKK